jgi:glutamyl-tRNA synthetase
VPGYDLAHGPAPADVVVALCDRVQTLKDMAERAAVWFQPLTNYDDAAVAKHLVPAAQAPLAAVRERFAAMPEWSAAAVHGALAATAEALGVGMGKIAQPLRVAITGTQVSPSIEHTVFLAGRAQALARIDAALARIGATGLIEWPRKTPAPILRTTCMARTRTCTRSRPLAPSAGCV